METRVRNFNGQGMAHRLDLKADTKSDFVETWHSILSFDNAHEASRVCLGSDTRTRTCELRSEGHTLG